MREAIFVQARFPSSDKELAALLKRWDGYGLVLRKSFGQQTIKIFSPVQKIEVEKNYQHLAFISESSNFFVNLVHSTSIIRTVNHSVTLVCGDNQTSLLFALILKMQMWKKIVIQTQFHGNIYSRETNPGIKGLIRIMFSRLAVYVSDSIRIVSKFQEPQIKNLARNNRAKFVTSPIPIDYSKIPDSNEFDQVFDIALIGRLHAERGVKEAQLILRELASIRPSLKIVIVGEGPGRKFLEEDLKNEIASGCISLLGALYGSELRRIYAQTRILLSAAQNEGYGLTLREAALSGMLVVARNSLGAQEAARNFSSGFYFYNSENEAVTQILNALHFNNRIKDNSALIAYQKEEDKEGLDRLLVSWVKD